MNADNNYPSSRYAWYMVIILMGAYVLSFIDRTILTLLVAPIREDLQITDTQLSLLHGIAFAIFYTTFGLPLGRLADRKNRVWIISIGMALWSIMTALCGTAKNFWQLFLLRMGVGVGEAALSPAAWSIISDAFPPERRARALSVYVVSAYVGMGIAYMVGGAVVKAVSGLPEYELPLLGVIRPWQLVFFIVGLPGLLYIIIIALTVREPSRKDTAIKSTLNNTRPERMPFGEILRYILARKRTYTAHFLGFGLMALIINGAALWTPTFVQRTYGWSTSDAGMMYGVVIMFFGSAGVYAGGWMTDRLYSKGNTGAAFLMGLVGAVGSIIPCFLMPLMPNATLAFILMAPMIFFGAIPFGVAIPALHQISPNEMRGLISAIYLFISNLVGIGFGPTVIAMMTDHFYGDANSLRYSMSWVLSITAIIATVILWWGLTSYKESARETSRIFSH